MYEFVKELSVKHLGNNNVEAKIRQQLQFLRDKGFVEFTTRGNYKKIGL
jgi:type II restriction enzyme